MHKIEDTDFFKRSVSDIPEIIEETSDPSNPKMTTRGYKTHEAYAVRVFLSLTELTRLLVQIDQAVIMLNTVQLTPMMKKAQITKYDYIMYNIENYLIRLQSVYDRMLILIDVVFMLGNDERNCKDQIILKNQYLKGHGIISKVNRLNKTLNELRPIRNKIIHAKSFKDDEMDRMQMLHILLETGENHPNENLNIPVLMKNYEWEMRHYVKLKKKAFEEMNLKVTTEIVDIFTELLKEYVGQFKRVKEI